MELALIGIAVVAVLYVIYVYNTLVKLRQRKDQSFADIDTQLTYRRDLVPNLVESVKGYAAHERETLDAVVTARARSANASTVAEKGAAEGMLGAALGRLFALSEAYPDLKANQNFLQLQKDLKDTEDKLAAARRFFNNSVQELNAAIQSFPAVLFARTLGFKEADFFNVGEEGRKSMDAPPSVKF